MDEELKKIIEYIGKNHPCYGIKFVHSWIENGDYVDSPLYDSYEETEEYINVLPVIVKKR